MNKKIRLQSILGTGETYLEDENGNRFGIKDNESYRMYRADSGGLIIYKIEDVDSIESIDDDTCMIILKNGSVHEHKKMIEIDSSIDPYEIMDYSNNDLHNTMMIIKHEFPDWINHLYFDLMDGRIHINRVMFGGEDQDRIFIGDGSDLLPIIDRLCMLTGTVNENNKIRTVRFKPIKQNVMDAMDMMAHDNTKNSFLDRISHVHWDGVPRIDTFLHDVGCRADGLISSEELLYLRFVGRAIFLVAIERSFDTDYRRIPFMPIIYGEQGQGKSHICEWIGMGWHKETTLQFRNEKKFYESSNGAVILELQEGTQLNESIDLLKAFTEKDRIQFRGSYDRFEKTIPIRFVMIATTNDMMPLTDGTGNRRFFPVRKTRDVLIKQIEDYTKDEILQLWAEALTCYKNGERWDDKLIDAGMDRIFKTMQKSVTSLKPPFNELRDYLDAYFGKIGDRITTSQIRTFLQEKGWYGKDSENLLQEFGRYYASDMGYKLLNATWIDGVKSRGYERIR